MALGSLVTRRDAFCGFEAHRALKSARRIRSIYEVDIGKKQQEFSDQKNKTTVCFLRIAEFDARSAICCSGRHLNFVQFEAWSSARDMRHHCRVSFCNSSAVHAEHLIAFCCKLRGCLITQPTIAVAKKIKVNWCAARLGNWCFGVCSCIHSTVIIFTSFAQTVNCGQIRSW